MEVLAKNNNNNKQKSSKYVSIYHKDSIRITSDVLFKTNFKRVFVELIFVFNKK